MSATQHRLLCAVVGALIVVLSPLVTVSTPAAAEQPMSEEWRIAASSVATGSDHTCVLTATGRVRCWGNGGHGRLGHNVPALGDDETPASAGDVTVGGKALAVAVGQAHTCALLTRGRVRCWGGWYGGLGYGNTHHVGDNETPAAAGDVPLGGKAIAITAGGYHSCALMADRGIRCWGNGANGRLGYGNSERIGDDEVPATVGDVPLGGPAIAVAAGSEHTCALMADRSVRCWGNGANGRLGYGNTDTIGDDETPATVGAVDVGGPAVAIAAGTSHTCAILTGGRARCWGSGLQGRLGYGNADTIGDDETPASAGDIDLGGTAAGITAGSAHTCALLTTGSVKCFGRGQLGRLGYGNTDHIGLNDTPADTDAVPMLEQARAIDAGVAHTCAIVPAGYLRCWGAGGDGRLGYGNTDDIGDDEVAHTAGRVDVGTLVRTHAETRLKLRAKPRRDRKSPYVYRMRGRVRGAFVADAATCTGKVRVTVSRRNGARVAAKTTRVKPDCRYRVKVRVRSAKLPQTRPVRLKVRARFVGNPDLGASRAKRTVYAR